MMVYDPQDDDPRGGQRTMTIIAVSLVIVIIGAIGMLAWFVFG